MANEIRIQTTLGVTNGPLNFPNIGGSSTYDQASPIAPSVGGVLVGTSEQTIDFGDVEAGWTFIQNLDLDNYVEFGFSSGVYGFVLPPEASCILKLNDAVTLYAKADTASCQLNIVAVND